MVQKIGSYGTQYEIICCASDFVFDENNGEIVLKNGKQSKTQLFRLQPVTATNLHTYYTIESVYRPEYALSLEGNLRLSIIDPNSASQQFRFEECSNLTILNSCVLINNFCERAVDVPESSDKQGERIAVWDKNYRWNQRWYFHKVQPNVYMIKSVINGLVLDIAGGSKQS